MYVAAIPLTGFAKFRVPPPLPYINGENNNCLREKWQLYGLWLLIAEIANGRASGQDFLPCVLLQILANWAVNKRLNVSTEPCDWLLLDSEPSCNTPSLASSLVTSFPKSADPRSVAIECIGGKMLRMFRKACIIAWLFNVRSGTAQPYAVSLSTIVSA